ncbi:MAG TPA: hypothetical protein VIG90_18195 [Pedomonas sp.]|uniref:hypothetical protein n=1 Tax=Pedomonas sp. TaxID=2976421 RepID=UPI002F4065A0
MNCVKLVLMMMAALVVAGCTSTKQMADVGFVPPQGEYRLLVMRPDVSVGLLTAGGAVEPREDWTDQARGHLLAALAQQQASRGGMVKVAATREEAGDPARVAELERLHKAVGASIALHKYLGQSLPTKKDRFDWTLGQQAVEFGQASGYDYALFLHAEDSFASSGRVALQAVSFLGCMVGVCIMPTGGQQAAYSSLVDLKTGQVVWFNVLSSTTGDIRTPEGAQTLVRNLLGKMKPGEETRSAETLAGGKKA